MSTVGRILDAFKRAGKSTSDCLNNLAPETGALINK